ncbi:diphthine--ammonia ligase isoform X2 [Lepus europaeus]|uniref:diphthine--ammonia ligase isoform X2 n=1 Tax=Lepus europaeus TaxID=9983 RepID=UPI002B4A270B|nr:diphthine--ammonia ligase isoform X2 [Lepus europaeus]
MRVAALISGGKDSCYNMMQCIAAGHQIVALANLRPAGNEVESDELDSYMYQTVGHHAIDLYAEAMALPLYRRTIRGRSLDTGLVYTKCEGDEVEDLYELLKLVKEKEEVEGISVGAILSDYQRVRVENVCKRLNLQPLAYLWQRNQEDLLREMIASNVQAVIIKVAAFGAAAHLANPQPVELAHGVLVPVGAPGTSPGCSSSSPALCCGPGRQWRMAQVLGPCTSMETRRKHLAPGFGLAQRRL